MKRLVLILATLVLTLSTAVSYISIGTCALWCPISRFILRVGLILKLRLLPCYGSTLADESSAQQAMAIEARPLATMLCRALLLVVLFLSTADAATYYVKTGGNNASAGTSWATAWATIAKVNTSITHGDTVRFGTGRWEGTSIVPPAGGTYSSRTVYACSTFTPATRGLSVISGGEPVTGWSVYSGNVYRASWSPAAGYLDAGSDGKKSYTLSQNDRLLYPQASVAAVNVPGEFFHDPSGNFIYAYLWDSANPSTVTMRASSRPAVALTAENQDHILFYGLDLRMGKAGTVLFRDPGGDGPGSDSIFFEHCNITRSSFMALENAAIIFIRGGGATPYDSSSGLAQYARWLTVKACSIGVCVAEASGVLAHLGNGVSAYDATDVLIDSTVFYNLDGDGYMVKNNYTCSEARCVGSQVTIRNTGFENIGGFGFDGFSKGSRDSVYGCVFVNCDYAAIELGGWDSGSGDGPMDWGYHFICNNTIYQCANAFQTRDPDNYPKGKFMYNVIYDVTLDGADDRYFATLNRSGHPVCDVDIDSNWWYDPSSSFIARVGTNSSTSWAQWQSAGYDANGWNGSMTFDIDTPSSQAMQSQTYGGRTWTVIGAVQDEPAACADTLVAPVFESPANGATGQQNSVILDWSDSTQAGTVDVYDLQVDDNSNFASLTFSSSPTDSRDTVTTTLSYWTTYYWRVRSRSDCDTSAWSGYRSFTMGDSCILLTGKTLLPTADTCYCIRDSLLYTFAQRDTLIHTNGKDNIRIYGSHSGGGRGIIGYSASDTGSNAWVTDSAKGSVVIHVSGSDNVLIKNLTIAPRTIGDSIRSIVCVNALTVVGIELDNDSIIAGGFSSRAYQQSTTGGNRSFNQLLQNSYFGTESKGYHRRDQLYGATIRLTTSILQSDRYGGSYDYAYKVRNCRIHTIHTGIGSAGLTVDTSPTPDDTVYPLIFIDSNTVTVDARNDLFMTYDDNDVNNSTGDPYGIAVDGVDRASRIQGNTISSMGATYYGGDGILLQHIDATVDSPFVVAYNAMTLQHGAHPRIAEGRQAVVGTYIRNYSAGYYVSGLWYHHNTGYLVVDSDDTSTYRGKLYECVRMGFDNGARNNIIENNHFSVVASDSATRTTIDSLQGSGLSFVQRDSLYTGREYTGRGTVARNNYWRVPKTPYWFGDTRIGYGANNCKIEGDTVNTIYDGDSTFVRFHQSGTYFDHHWQNTIKNVTLQGYANYTDVVKGNINDTTELAYPTENKRRQGKQLELVQTMNLLITDEESTPISDATVWAVNDYNKRIDFSNSDGSGLTAEDLRWRFYGYDVLSDGFTVEDSTAFNDFTIWAKSGSDSASVTWTLGTGRAVTDTIAITQSTPSPMNSIRGTTIKGVVIK